MKKTRLLIVLAFLSSALVLAGETFSYGGLTYKTLSSSDAVYVTGVTQGSSSTNIYIPGSVYYNGTNHRVWGVSDNAFQNNTTVTKVEFSWGTRIVGVSSFSGCTNLTEVHLSSSIARIDASAFAGCTSLQKVYYASFDFPALGCQASSWPSNSGMTLYISPLSEKTTSEWLAATGWSKFSSAVMSGDACDFHLQDGGQYSVGSTDAEGIDVLRYLTLVGYKKPSRIGAYDYTEDGTVYKPESNIMDGGIMFHFTSIGTAALQNKTALKTIDLSNAIFLDSIHHQAFSGCSALTTLKISSSVRSIATTTFIDGCTSLEAVSIDSENQSFANYGSGGEIYSKDLTELRRVPEGKIGAVSYPNTLKVVNPYAHKNCKKITLCMLPYGVETIYYSAYAGTSGLLAVFIPSSVTMLYRDYVFQNSNPSLNIYCNMDNPPTVDKSTYFGDNSGMKLYIPYGKESVYSAAGWTGFATVNNNSTQAYDFNRSNLCYTVTSTESTTINGTTYDGRVKLICAAHTAGGSHSTYDIPASVTYNNKTYAVTRIGEDAFNNLTTDFSVTGCLNVDTIGEYAFRDQPITSYPFTHTLKSIGHYAFYGTNLTGTVAIPYGVKYIGNYAFANGKYSRFVMPNSVTSFYGTFCANTTTLTELVINKSGSTYYNYAGWNLGTVPSTCYIRVPVGVVDHYKQNSALSSRADHITAGAYDFAYNKQYTGRIFLSILNTTPVTYDGTTYAGKAKYVYHPNIKSTTMGYGFSVYEEDRTVTGDYRKYLITEIGDSCFADAQFTNSYPLPSALTRIGDFAFYNAAYAKDNLSLPSGLTYIGKGAFYGTKLTGEIKIPSSVTTIGIMAFYGMTELSSLYFPGAKPTNMGDLIWTDGSSNPNLTVWLPNTYASQYVDQVDTWGSAGQINWFAKPLGVWFKPDAGSVPFSSVLSTNLSGSDINAYIATAYDKSNPNQQLTMTKVDQAAANTGMILTDLTAGQEYRINQPTSTVSAPATNYLVGTPRYAVRIDQQTVGYYWDDSAATPHFIKPIDPPSYSNAGEAYLKLSSTQASGIDEVYTNLWPKPMLSRGDINGDDKVDVSDVNIIINIMLGKALAISYPGDADLNSDGNVDVSDVNAVINIMLGKE